MKILNNIATIAFLLLLFCLSIVLFFGCSSFTQLKSNFVEPPQSNMLYSLPPGDFSKLWIQRTVKLSVRNPESPSSPLFGGGEPGERSTSGRMIPMNIDVTFFDSLLVEAGLREFEGLAKMSESEKAEYEKKYKSQFNFDNSYLFWMEMNSPYSEDALAANKWSFYLENEKGDVLEPEKITPVEKDQLLSSAVKPGNEQINKPNSRPGGMQRGGLLRLNSKIFILSFPKKTLNGIDIVHSSKSLKLVYFEWSTRDVKREGLLNVSNLYL
jgi:hypothetical protein